MSKNNMKWCVAKLSEKYGFPTEEALAYLESCETKKAKREVPAFPLPYCGMVCEDWCKAVRFNRGLMTQCTNTYKKGEMYCSTCTKTVDPDTNKPSFGLITERSEADWKSPDGKSPVVYGNIMSKLKYQNEPLNEDMVKAEASKFGWSVPETEFVPSPARKGRPAKKAAQESEEGPKKRGRPVKTKPVTVGETGDDLIASLVAQAKLQETITPPAEEETAPPAEEETAPPAEEETAPPAEEETAPPAEEETAPPAEEETAPPSEKSDKVKKAQCKVSVYTKEFNAGISKEVSSDEEEKKPKKSKEVKQGAKEAKEAEKQAAKEAKEAEKQGAKEAKEAEKQAAKEAKEAEKQSAKQAKKTAKQAKDAEKESAEKLAKKDAEKLAKKGVEELDSEGELSEEDEVSVMKFNYKGKDYLREVKAEEESEDVIVYDFETQEELGTWDGSNIKFA